MGHVEDGSAKAKTVLGVRASMKIKAPLVIMFEDEGTNNVVCHLYPSEKCGDYESYGLLVCDLVRHVARLFDVEEGQVWEWVDKERTNPTTEITRRQ
jgi:hypothetical protein